MQRILAAIAATSMLAGCEASAQQQDRQLTQLPAEQPGARLSPDLTTIVATGANFVGVTRAGAIVVRPTNGLDAAQASFKALGIGLQPTALPTRPVNELIVSLASIDVPPLADLPGEAGEVERVATGPFAVVRAPNGITAALVSELARRAGVTRVEPNYPFFLQAAAQAIPDDPEFPNQWALDHIHAARAWMAGTSSHVIIAVLDTGIDTTHPDLVDNLWRNTKDTGKDEDGNRCPGDRHGCDFTGATPRPLTGDPEGHGTHGAGTIGARGNNTKGIAGVVWDAKVLGVAILGKDLTADASDVVKGIDYAIATNAKIISASFGSYHNELQVEKAVKRAAAAGVIIVAAAGNVEVGIERDNDRKMIYPASYANPNVLAVMASDRSGMPARESRVGPKTIHLAAPGVSILSLEPNGGIRSRTGTSMAVPFVAGAAALYWSQHPAQSAGQVVDAIRRGVAANTEIAKVTQWKGVLDVAFLAPRLTTVTPKPAPPKALPVPAPLPFPKPVQIGELATWTGRLQSIFAAGGETSGLALTFDGQRIELTASQVLLQQLRALVGQTVTIRGQREQLKGVERLRDRVRVTELVKQ